MVKNKKLFNSAVVISALVGFILLIAWDVLWCMGTTFRGMSFPATYASAFLLALILALPTLFSRNWWLQLIVWLIVAALLEANLMYCRTYLSWIPLESYLLAGNLSDFTASIADSLRWTDLILAIIPIGGAIWLRKAIAKSATADNKATYFIVLGATVIVCFLLTLLHGNMAVHIEKLRNECYYATTPPVVYTIAGPLMTQAFSQEGRLSDEDYQFAKDWMNAQAERESQYPIAQRQGRKNLIVIYCESLESWLIEGKADGDKVITPFLNSLIVDSSTLYLPHVTSQVGTGRSIDAQLLMLAGMYPLENKVWSMKFPLHTYLTIPQAMKGRDKHTQTMLLTCDKPITWNQQLVAEAFGVDSIISRDCWEMTEMVGNPAKLSDSAFMQQSEEKLRNGEIWEEGTPAYLHFVTYSGHNPFRLPDNLKGINITGDYPEKMLDYMTMANYTDRSLKPLIDYLKTRSDWDETMVVIVGDHEALGSYRQEWLKNNTAAAVLSPNTEVPLIILNSPVPGRLDIPIGQVDVYSTIVDLMGLREYAWPGMGQSVFNPDRTPYDAPDAHASEGPHASQILITHDLLKDESISHLPPKH